MIRVAPIKCTRLKRFRLGGLHLLLSFCAPVVCIKHVLDTSVYTTLTLPEKSPSSQNADNKSSSNVPSHEKESLSLEPLLLSSEPLFRKDTIAPTKKQLRKRRLGSNNKNVDQWKHMVDSYLEQPMKYWSVGQWVGLGVVFLVVLCCILPSCKRYEYYNAGYRSVPAGAGSGVYYRSSVPPGYYNAQRPGFSCLDALCFLCCLECCCSRQQQQDGDCCNLLCGLCCFEFCCRGGRDIGLNQQSVIY